MKIVVKDPEHGVVRRSRTRTDAADRRLVSIRDGTFAPKGRTDTTTNPLGFASSARRTIVP